jgi:polysaccharide biosynthesis protein VpsM
MSSDYGSPSSAIGGYRPPGDMVSSGVRVEPFTIRAGAHAGLGYDDNVRLSQTNRVSSMFLTMSPSIAVGLERENQRYYLVYCGNYARYFNSSPDDYADHNVALTAAHELTGRFRTSFLYEHVRSRDPQGSSTVTAASGLVRWHVNAVRGTVSYGAEGAQGRLEGTAGYLNKVYDTALPPGVARDYEQFELGGAFLYRLAPKTRAIFELRRAEISHRLDPLLDSTETRYLVGANWDVTASTTGAFRVGYMVKDPENPAAETFSGPTYEASITWAPLDYSRFAFNGRRTFSEPVEIGSPFVIDSLFSAAWTHVWPRGIQSLVGYTFGQQRHEGIGRSDTYHTFDVKATYPIHRRVRVGAEFRRDVRNSPVPLLDFRRNLSLLTIEGSL